MGLLARARDSSQSWRARCLATLLLQCQLARLHRPAGTGAERARVADEYWRWFVAFGLTDGQAGDQDTDQAGDRTLGEQVLTQGYSTRALTSFIEQFHRRIARRTDALAPAADGRMTAAQCARLLHLSQCESLLELGRFVFSASEVADRVEELAITTGAMPESMGRASALAADEVPRALDQLPAYERAIAALLIERVRAYWIPAERTWHARGLLDHPERSAALVISPPGSSFEFEIKRAGCGERRVVNIIFRRAGRWVPPSHRLWGLCDGTLLRFEATAGGRLARRYRLLHGGSEAPIARMLAIRTVQEVPGPRGPAHIMDYFTYERSFGEGFLAMRKAMEESVAAFDAKTRRLGNHPVPECPGPVGLTMRFFTHCPPSQALLVGTSACRLDLLARALAPEAAGAAQLEDPLQREVFAAEVLAGQIPGAERALGDIEPLFSAPEVRAQVESVYLHVLEQIATLWATMLALRMVSHGESLVVRNLGLRTQFVDGRWQVRVISMDHDRLRPCQGTTPSDGLRTFLCGAVYDGRFLFGYRPEPSSDQSAGRPKIGDGDVVGSLDLLERIYRIDGDRAKNGRAHFLAHMRAVYRRMRREISAQVDVEPEFSAAHVSWSDAIDEAARCYGRAGGRHGENWPKACGAALQARGWEPEESARSLAAMAGNHPAMKLLADLVEPGDGDRS